jgi:hypothetical protein
MSQGMTMLHVADSILLSLTSSTMALLEDERRKLGEITPLRAQDQAITKVGKDHGG